MTDLKNSMPNVKTQLPGPKTKAAFAKRKAVMPSAIKSIYPVAIARGEGAMVEDLDGNVFLDFVGGVGVMNIGYSHPEVIKAVKEQSEKYFHAMINVFTHEGYLDYAEAINEIAPVRALNNEKQTMFCNTGAEAVENAVKIAKGTTKRPNIIVFSGAFHGRTSLTMEMTSSKIYSLGMGPFPDGVYRTEYPYVFRRPKGISEDDACDYFVQKIYQTFETQSPPQYTAAIVFEPIQGEGGFVPAPVEWVRQVRKICDEYRIMMVVDEVQSGFARSGRMFVSDYFKDIGCEPDIMAFAKSAAGGLPIGGVVTSKEIMDKVPPGTIGGTFSGNAMACASALAVLKVMQNEDYPKKARDISKICEKTFSEWKDKYREVGDVRAVGAMIGIEFIEVSDANDKAPNKKMVDTLVEKAWSKGLIIESAGYLGNIIRFLCPLCVTEDQLNKGLSILEECIKEYINDSK